MDFFPKIFIFDIFRKISRSSNTKPLRSNNQSPKKGLNSNQILGFLYGGNDNV